MSRKLGTVLVLSVLVLVPLATAGPTANTDFTTVEITADHSNSGIGQIEVSPDDLDKWVYADCGGGLSTNAAVSSDRGQTWDVVQVEAVSSAGKQCDVAFSHANPDHIAMSYIDRDDDDLDIAVSTDGGVSWSVADSIISKVNDFTFSAVVWADEDTVTGYAFMPANGNVFAATSNDTGSSYDADRVIFGIDETNDQPSRFFSVWHQNPDNPSSVRFFSESGTALSNDGGVTWPALSPTGVDTALGWASTDEESMALIDGNSWIVVAVEGSESPPLGVVRTDDGGASYSVLMRGSTFTPLQVGADGEKAWGVVYLNATSQGATLMWSEDRGSTWTNVTALDSAGDCEGNQCGPHSMVARAQGYVVVGEDTTDDDRLVSFTNFTEPEPPVPGPEPVDFAQGFDDAVVSLGFRTERSQMFFALALIGMTTVATGTALKFMGSSRMKNWMIAGAAMGVGAFTVLVFFVEFWMVLLAMVVGGAILQGPNTFLNTLSELRQEAERTVGGQAVPESETVADPEDPGMVDVGEAEMVDVGEAEMVETTAQVDVGEGTQLIDVGEAEDVEV